METLYNSLILLSLIFVIYYLIRSYVACPPSLYFLGRLEIWQLPSKTQETIQEKRKKGTKYTIKLLISTVILVILILVFPVIFGNNTETNETEITAFCESCGEFTIHTVNGSIINCKICGFHNCYSIDIKEN